MTLFLQFKLAQQIYLLDTRAVIAVLAVPVLKGLPGAHPGVVGLLNYQGEAVPVIDLALLASGQPSVDRMSTRIMLVCVPVGQSHKKLGVIAEQVTRVERRDGNSFARTGLNQAPWLGDVAPSDSGLAQQVLIENLLPADVRDALFISAEREGVA